jgi:hypothetical protein
MSTVGVPTGHTRAPDHQAEAGLRCRGMGRMRPRLRRKYRGGGGAVKAPLAGTTWTSSWKVYDFRKRASGLRRPYVELNHDQQGQRNAV